MKPAVLFFTLSLFVATGLPRFFALDSHWSSDETLWLNRSAHFISAVKQREFSETLITHHPGVITMWLAGLRTFFISCHVLLWGCQGLAFFLFIRSFFPVAWTEAAVLTACYAFAWIVGFLSFLTPGGLGVREGLLSLLLASYMPLSQATLVALFYRVWILSTEIILAGVALFLYKKRG